jgi:HD-like signal output (HDOD) protein
MGQEKIQSFLGELPKMREDLPFSPRILKKLFVQTCSNSNSSLEDVGETLSRDQGLTTRILSLANSAYYGLQAEVQSVQRAAAVLGMGEIRNIVLALGVHSLTKKYPLPEEFKIGDYWEHQLLVGMVARELSRMSGVGAPDNMFTIGMLHDVGQLITALRRPDDWQAIQDMVESDEMLLQEAEEEYWGMDHAVVGALMLKSWELPADLVEPVNWHHSPELSPEHSNESMIICLANSVIQAIAAPEGVHHGLVEGMCYDMELDMTEIMEQAGELAESDAVEQFVRILN